MLRVAVALVLIGIAACERAPESTREQRLALAEAARAAIEAELAEPDLPSWAGEYHADSGLTSERLFLAPRSGFAYFCRCCTGEDTLSGRVRVDGDVLRLDLTVPEEYGCERTRLDELVFATKGPQRALLRGENDIAKACNVSTGGQLPSRCFVRVVDEELDSSGPLVVPPSFRKYQLQTPIVGRVTRAERVEYVDHAGRPRRRARVRIDVGDDTRALAGMTFYVALTETESGRSWELFTMESAGSGSELELFAYLPETKPLPRVGARASTSPD
ncbi:MAG: hypothetical protein HZA52_19385 [Planctomycetes bacterium]|nr:hypothetical protein [Planctomycetota bacterium]